MVFVMIKHLYVSQVCYHYIIIIIPPLIFSQVLTIIIQHNYRMYVSPKLIILLLLLIVWIVVVVSFLPWQLFPCEQCQDHQQSSASKPQHRRQEGACPDTPPKPP